eukprot:TRINITY_DN1266_c0_g1_i1.p1 TRINITY_DN1266_c0_g1~~TRINITY_DN1266_c0_g1_i1.p1  ORF type:complete len:641 (+),score=294.82 TRINITY_DN1266_c0_g1_i1:66-1988(+)
MCIRDRVSTQSTWGKYQTNQQKIIASRFTHITSSQSLPMLSARTRSKLASLVDVIAQAEKQCEVSRQVLAELIDYEPSAAFRRLDRYGYGYIIPADVLDFLAVNRIDATSRDVDLIFYDYSSGQDGRITYADFQNIALPQDSVRLRDIAVSRRPLRSDILTSEVEWALARVFETEIRQNRVIEGARSELEVQPDFSVNAAFREIDIENLGFIDHAAVRLFQRDAGITLTEDEIAAFIRRVNVTGTGRITYSEFSDELLAPKTFPIYDRRSPSRIVTTELRVSSPSRRDRIASPSRTLVSETIVRRSGSPTRNSITREINSDYRRIERSPSPSRRTVIVREDLSPSRRIIREELSPSRRIIREELSPSRRIIREELSPSRRIVREEVVTTTTRLSPSRRSYSPLRGTDEEELVVALKQQIDLDKQIESAKVDLALRSDFNLQDAFRYFDVSNRNAITRYELEEGLRRLGVYATVDELNLFFKRYDKASSGTLRYGDFSDALAPRSAAYNATVTSRGSNYSRAYDPFLPETTRLFSRVWRLLLDAEAVTETIRQRLSRRPGFSINNAFDAIELRHKGFITVDDFRNILLDWGIFASYSDAAHLVERYDRNRDGVISYGEFIREIAPQSPRRYQKREKLNKGV